MSSKRKSKKKYGGTKNTPRKKQTAADAPATVLSLNKSRFSPALRVRLVFIVAAFLSFAADRLTKTLMLATLSARPEKSITLIPGYLDFVISHNRGGAFGLFAGVPIFMLYIPVIIVLALLIFLIKNRHVGILPALGLALQFGGAMGNLLDRIRLGYVFDFIECHLRERAYWPTYNVADICIVIGTFLFAWSLFTGDFLGENKK